MTSRLSREIKSFASLWQGGYLEGDPLDPLGRSGYGQIGFMSVLHATYLRCIKPYVNCDTIALEIGPGGGAWTKALLPAREVVVIDVLPADWNRFFEYVGHPPNVRYHQIADFSCSVLPEDYFTYMFSFGCLCHVSFEGIREYAVNLYPKLRKGSNCFWMVADYSKYNLAASNLGFYSIWRAIEPRKKILVPLKWLLRSLVKGMRRRYVVKPDRDNKPSAGRWYDAGTQRTCAMLKEVGYRIADSDVGTCHRDPIIHFEKT